jgi:predicted anti-sigma-YlaC factor YlaD
MMEHNDELYLKQTVGNRNPFRVPDGYFEQLTEQVMQQLPEREQIVAKQQSIAQPASQPRARKVQMRPWLYAAACTVLAMILGVSYYFMQSSATSTDVAPMASVAPATYVAPDNSYIDEAVDYAMMDNADIYACLSENY